MNDIAQQFTLMLTIVRPLHRPIFSSAISFPTLQQRIKIELKNWTHWFFCPLQFITVCICSVLLGGDSFCLSLPPFTQLEWLSSVARSCPTLCDPMDCSMPGLPVHHQLPEFTQTHVHWVGDAIQNIFPQYWIRFLVAFKVFDHLVPDSRVLSCVVYFSEFFIPRDCFT